MSLALHPCRHCARHVRADERACPFCGSEVRRALPRTSLGLVIVAGAALTLAGCDGGLVATAHADIEDEPVRQTPQYGAPSYDPEPPPPPPQQGPRPRGVDAGTPPTTP
jgi:hypothetical protein